MVIRLSSACSTTTPQRGCRPPVLRGPSSDVDVVDVAPAPVFARLERLGDRVPDGECVPASVAHRGGVTTPDMTARQAEPQMYPAGAEFQTLLAALGGPWRYRTNQHQMRIANGCHGSLRL